MLDSLKSYLVEDWRKALKWSSVRVNLALIGLNLLAQAMPVLDPQIAAMLPAQLRSPATGIYATLMLALRLTKLKAGD